MFPYKTHMSVSQYEFLRKSFLSCLKPKFSNERLPTVLGANNRTVLERKISREIYFVTPYGLTTALEARLVQFIRCW